MKIKKKTIYCVCAFLLAVLMLTLAGCGQTHTEEIVSSEGHNSSGNSMVSSAVSASDFSTKATTPVATPSRVLMNAHDNTSCIDNPYNGHEIRSITFLDTCEDAPEETWDVSAAGDGSVLAWVKKRGAVYDLYIAAEGGVIAPEHCDSLFMGCWELEEIAFNDAFDTSGVTSMRYMFSGCENLKSLDLRCFDTSSVVSMTGMFLNCSRLYSVDLSSFNTSAVASNSDTSNINGDFNFMFSNCSQLNDLDLSSFDTSHAVSMRSMFDGCLSLTRLDVSSFTFEKVTDVRNMFKDCPGVTVDHVKHFQFDTAVTTKYENFMNGNDWAFLFDPSAPGPREPEHMINWEDAHWCFNSSYFDAVSSYDVQSLTFLDTLKDAPADAWDASLLKNRQVLAWAVPDGSMYDLYIAAEGGIDAPSDCSYLFDYFSKVERIYFNNAFHTGHVTDMTGMFEGCEKLISLDLRCFDTSKVVSMAEMFYDCESLIYLDISSFNTSRVVNMNSMFSSCTSLKKLELYHFDTSSVLDMGGMFCNCESLKQLDLTAFDTRLVQNMQGMFCYSGISELDIRSFDTSSVISMDYMFAATGFRTLDLSHFETDEVRNMAYMFAMCSSLESVNVSGFDTDNVTNMSYMFSYLYQLKELDLGSFTFDRTEDVRYMFCNTPCITPEFVQELPIDPAVTTEYEGFMDGTGWEQLFQ